MQSMLSFSYLKVMRTSYISSSMPTRNSKGSIVVRKSKQNPPLYGKSEKFKILKQERKKKSAQFTVKQNKKLTSHYILRSSISISTHHSCWNMGLISHWPILCKAKVWKLRIKVLHIFISNLFSGSQPNILSKIIHAYPCLIKWILVFIYPKKGKKGKKIMMKKKMHNFTLWAFHLLSCLFPYQSSDLELR